MKPISRNPVASRNSRVPRVEEEGERTLSDQAYRLLHRDILSGVLEPDSKLRLQGLQDRYGLGMSPIREALMLLSREGPVSAEDLRDIVSARVHIETILLTESILRGDADWGAEISAAFYKLTHEPVPVSLDDAEGVDAWEAAHRRFHRALLGAASSPWLHRINGQLIDHAERYRRLRLARMGFTAKTDSIFNEHRALMEATLSRDVSRACTVLREHLNATLAVIDYLDEPASEQSQIVSGRNAVETPRSTPAARAQATGDASPESKRAAPRRARKSVELVKA
jgi:GntR family carbon starvation induced transcriptional regulator